MAVILPITIHTHTHIHTHVRVRVYLYMYIFLLYIHIHIYKHKWVSQWICVCIQCVRVSRQCNKCPEVLNHKQIAASEREREESWCERLRDRVKERERGQVVGGELDDWWASSATKRNREVAVVLRPTERDERPNKREEERKMERIYKEREKEREQIWYPRERFPRMCAGTCEMTCGIECSMLECLDAFPLRTVNIACHAQHHGKSSVTISIRKIETDQIVQFSSRFYGWTSSLLRSIEKSI